MQTGPRCGASLWAALGVEPLHVNGVFTPNLSDTTTLELPEDYMYMAVLDTMDLARTWRQICILQCMVRVFKSYAKQWGSYGKLYGSA